MYEISFNECWNQWKKNCHSGVSMFWSPPNCHDGLAGFFDVTPSLSLLLAFVEHVPSSALFIFCPWLQCILAPVWRIYLTLHLFLHLNAILLSMPCFWGLEYLLRFFLCCFFFEVSFSMTMVSPLYPIWIFTVHVVALAVIPLTLSCCALILLLTSYQWLLLFLILSLLFLMPNFKVLKIRLDSKPVGEIFNCSWIIGCLDDVINIKIILI